VAQRHGGVIGLAALVRSSPYAVPPWLPAVLDQLVQHANDPFPVNKEVQATVAEFKRTHQDRWEECVLAFTEEQLSRILDNSSALAHYA
jgi:proteasome activator subunit 4